jgi:hypothetical protein
VRLFGRINGFSGLGCGKNVYFRGRPIATKVDLTAASRTL